MGRLVVGDVVYRHRSLVGDVAMADPPILIDFGDNNPDQWDREPRPDQLALPIEFPDREHTTMNEDLETAYNTEIRGAAHCVALNWRDAMSGGDAPDVIADRLHRSLEHLLAVFERHADRRLEELAVDREHRLVPEPPQVTRRRPIKRVETKEDLL